MSQEIDDIFRDVTITCETCDEEAIFEADDGYVDFRAMNAELKQSGWITYKDGDEWCHKCPNCVQYGRSEHAK